MTTCWNASCPRCCARPGAARSAADLDRFLSAAAELGLHPKVAAGLASQVARADADPDRPTAGRARPTPTSPSSTTAIAEREQVHGRSFKHYRTALRATRTVLYHLGAPAHRQRRKHARTCAGPGERHFDGVPAVWPLRWSPTWNAPQAPAPAPPCSASRAGSAHFARFLAHHDPALTSLAALDRQRHIEPYLAAVAAARQPAHRQHRCRRPNDAAGSSPSAG